MRYRVEPDFYGDLAIWAYNGDDDSFPVAILFQNDAYPAIWDAAIKICEA